MSVKEFIQLFVPPIYYRVKHILCPQKTSEVHPLPKLEHTSNCMVVIGNGPSLNKTVELYLDKLQNSECMMVNYAVMTDLYEQIKPSIYVLTDPGWYAPMDFQMQSGMAAAEAIVQKTAWPMTIIMPQSAENGYAEVKFRANHNLRVLFYHDEWVVPKNYSIFEAWDKNLVSPPGQTVLNTCVWLSIYWGYKVTYIVGADTTWMENSRMDQTNNRLYEYDKHFYASQDVYGKSKFRKKNDFRYLNVTYSQSLMEMYNVIHGYEELEEYAKWKGVKVYNASEYSWIDAFERKKLDTIA